MRKGIIFLLIAVMGCLMIACGEKESDPVAIVEVEQSPVDELQQKRQEAKEKMEELREQQMDEAEKYKETLKNEDNLDIQSEEDVIDFEDFEREELESYNPGSFF